MKAKELLDSYRNNPKYCYDGRIEDTWALRVWLEKKFNKVMPHKLFVAMGKGGGQTYKTLWEVFDATGNNNQKCVFFNENKKAIDILVKNGHTSLQDWIDGK
jgi:hypothetical protein